MTLPAYCRYEMRLTLRWGSQWERRYVAEGRHGACEFWVRELPSGRPGIGVSDESYSCGFEVHSPTPTRDGPPDHQECWALTGRCCWHDGTSSWARDSWLPMWLENPNNHEIVFNRLALEYRRRFEPQEAGCP